MTEIVVRGVALREVGPVLPIRIGVAPEVERERRRQGLELPTPIEARALIDTGSGRSIVRSGLPGRLGLSPVGRVEIDTPSSADVLTPEYRVRFWFPEGVTRECTALEAPLPVVGLHALLGRDVLDGATFTYDGVNQEFSLRL